MLAFLGGCGDTFRPVSNPIAQPGGDPSGTVEHAIVLSANFVAPPSGNTGVPAPGTTMHIDVSGDTVVAVENVFVNPVHAAIIGGSVVVANKDSNSVSVYPVTAGPNASVQTLTLPLPAVPVFVASTDNTNIYVAQFGRNSVGVVPLSSNPLAETTEITASISKPVAITQLPNGEIYVANQGNNTVTVIDPATFQVKGTPISVGTSPTWLVASADGNCVYVADNGSNDVAVISSAGGATTKPVPKIIGVGGGPSFLRFDPKLQRVYVVNNTGNSVSVIAHSADCNSTLLTTTPISVGPAPQSLAALSDGTRAYVANSDGSVTVINTSSNTVRKTIPASTLPGTGVGTMPKIVSIGSSADGTKVVVTNNGDPNLTNFIATPTNPSTFFPGSVSVIRTSDDTVVLQLPNPTAKTTLPGGTTPQYVLMNP